MHSFRDQLKKIPCLVRSINIIRSALRQLRTGQLRLLYPEGGYLRCNGIKVFCDFKDRTYAWYDQNSPHLYNEMRLFEKIIDQQPGNVYLDIGAHFGYFSRIVAQRNIGTDRKLICLEPDKKNFRCLERTMADLTGKCNFELMPYAISEHNGEIKLYGSGLDCLHTYSDSDGRSSVCYKVNSICLDKLVSDRISNDDRIAFIKIDIDGAEPVVFSGGMETIRKHKPVIFMEFSPFVLRKAGVYPEEFFNMLNKEFHVYWYKKYALQKVREKDYSSI